MMEGLERRSCFGFCVDVVENVRRVGKLVHRWYITRSDRRSERFAIDAIVLEKEDRMGQQWLTMRCSRSSNLEVWLNLPRVALDYA